MSSTKEFQVGDRVRIVGNSLYWNDTKFFEVGTVIINYTIHEVEFDDGTRLTFFPNNLRPATRRVDVDYNTIEDPDDQVSADELLDMLQESLRQRIKFVSERLERSDWNCGLQQGLEDISDMLRDVR